jgi:hypothetical protein
LQGGGKSVGVTIFSYDIYVKKKYNIFANFWLSFGKLISIKDLLDFKYSNCVIILDEAYGVADSHQTSKANDNLAEVIHQSRKKKVEVFFSTQLEGDLYKRVRTSAHRKVLCENLKTEEEPILRYTIMNQNDEVLRRIVLNTELVRKSYPLFNTDEVIMPMHLNPELTYDEVLNIFNDASSKKGFATMLNEENKFIVKDIGEAVYEAIKNERHDRARRLLKLK